METQVTLSNRQNTQPAPGNREGYNGDGPGGHEKIVYHEELIHEHEHGTSDDFAKYVKYGLLAAGGTIGLGVLGYYLWRKVISTGEEKKAFNTDSPASYAKEIKQGLDNNNWPGADTVTVRKALVSIPDKQAMRKVSKSYNKLYGEPLGSALQTGLKTTEYTEMMAILRSKPEKHGNGKEQVIYDPSGWAERLNAAVNYEWWGIGWGTDTDAIKQVFKEIPTQKAWEDVKEYYQSEYQTEIVDDLNDDIDSDEYDFLAVIAKKPIQ
jgi:hypothetical protein